MFNLENIEKRLWTAIDIIIFTVIVIFIYSSFNRLTAQNQLVLPQKNAAQKSTRNHSESPLTSLLGIDVSHYQGQVDWKQVANSYHFAFIKATEGNHYQDPAFERNIQSVANTDMAFGVYHFFEPNTEAIEQASHFLETIQNYDFLLPPVLDVEVTPDGDMTSFQNAIEQWLNTVKKSTGCSPIIYTNKTFWNKYLKERFSDHRIWISDYTTEDSKVENIPWSFWQFSDSDRVEGISGLVDESRYRGSETSLSQLGSCKA